MTQQYDEILEAILQQHEAVNNVRVALGSWFSSKPFVVSSKQADTLNDLATVIVNLNDMLTQTPFIRDLINAIEARTPDCVD